MCRGKANCRGINSVVLLAAFDEWLDHFGRDEFDVVTCFPDDARPMMRCSAGFEYDLAALKLAEERCNLAPAQLSLEKAFSTRIRAVRLKNGLGDIQADCGNCHPGGLL